MKTYFLLQCKVKYLKITMNSFKNNTINTNIGIGET